MFEVLVAPVLGFCAEVWAPTLLRGSQGPLECMDSPPQRVQSLFMRRLGGGLLKSTSRHLMLCEFGCRPLVRGWTGCGWPQEPPDSASDYCPMTT
jgi:hypothetical protein